MRGSKALRAEGWVSIRESSGLWRKEASTYLLLRILDVCFSKVELWVDYNTRWMPHSDEVNTRWYQEVWETVPLL